MSRDLLREIAGVGDRVFQIESRSRVAIDADRDDVGGLRAMERLAADKFERRVQTFDVRLAEGVRNELVLSLR